jgi:anti-sigma factor RsiW
MNNVNDQDWELLNAYLDGELSAPDAAAIARRIAGDPTLSAALADIRELSRTLRQLRPPAAQAPAPNPVPHPASMPTIAPRRAAWRPLALAAAVAVATVFAGALYFLQPGQPDSPAAWHKAFLARAYSVPLSDPVQPVRLFGLQGVPDLASANLTLVDRRNGADGAMALHYTGRNGCRLTLTAGFDAAPVAMIRGGIMRSSWIAGGIDYMVLANGMDMARFDAISLYIRQLTGQSAQPATVLAMRLATERAVPCTPKA